MPGVRKLKLCGVVVAFLGLAASFLDHVGWFRDPEKVMFADLVMSSSGSIPRATPGFEAFLADFPPPQGVSAASVSEIGDKALRYDTSAADTLNVVYVAQGRRTGVVARLDQVRDWAYATSYTLLSLVIATLGWLMYAATEVYETYLEKRVA